MTKAKRSITEGVGVQVYSQGTTNIHSYCISYQQIEGTCPCRRLNKGKCCKTTPYSDCQRGVWWVCTTTETHPAIKHCCSCKCCEKAQCRMTIHFSICKRCMWRVCTTTKTHSVTNGCCSRKCSVPFAGTSKACCCNRISSNAWHKVDSKNSWVPPCCFKGARSRTSDKLLPESKQVTLHALHALQATAAMTAVPSCD